MLPLGKTNDEQLRIKKCLEVRKIKERKFFSIKSF